MFSKANAPLVAGVALLGSTVAFAIASSDFRMAGIIAMAGGAIMCVAGIVGSLMAASRPVARATSADAVVASGHGRLALTAVPRPAASREWPVRRRSLIPTH